MWSKTYEYMLAIRNIDPIFDFFFFCLVNSSFPFDFHFNVLNLERLGERQFEWLISIVRINKEAWNDISFFLIHLLVTCKNIQSLCSSLTLLVKDE